MTRVLLPLLAGVVALATSTPDALAQSRYTPRPPIVLSPNLTEPWVVQLRPSYRDVAGPMPAAVAMPERPAMVPVAVAPARLGPVALNPDSDGSRERTAQVPARGIKSEFLPTVVDYRGPYRAGTVVIDTNTRHLYLVEEGGKARRYGVGVGRPGFEWAGEHRITRKAEWPAWRPPAEMLARQPQLPRFMEGGPRNPLGARAMYLGSSLYRIHGSNEPWTIGQAVSSGCIRMRNEDVVDLYERVKVGTRVIVM
ncbi:L,D-transpeptidase [Prosthecomicrobium sp. N25]|uniref:L,D-transpeptidase n=1 Tax=Prosthecomicrobium sp. N25 TaxID=3129254 RepID=UPI003077AD87